jgi:formylglycine-generating enzyme required for sulfatase activity
VSDPNNKVVVKVNLKPAYGYISVPAIGELAGATIYVDNEMVGQPPLKTKPLASGTHTVMAMKPLYQPKEQSVTIADGQTLEVRPEIIADYSSVTLTVANNAEIWVNGERKGFGCWMGDLASGEYKMETRLANHRTVATSKQITAAQRIQTITLEAPIPIYGSINISTKPDMSDVYIDEELVGQTPLFLPQYLIGKHNVRISRSNFGDYQASVTVNEGRMAEVGGALNRLTNEPQKSSTMIESQLANKPQTFSVKGVSFTMILVKGGTFNMGATFEQSSSGNDEKPIHPVTLSDYYIGETEVTQALWSAVMGENPSNFKENNRPVEQVSWNDCQTFIRKLNALTGKNFRLPTEAEWEYAARGGSERYGYQYSGSNNLSAVAWYGNNSGCQTHKVKTKSPNELGIYDMSGNVWEWCQDWYASYSSDSVTNPTGAASGSCRVRRGGGWGGDARCCRSAYRNYRTPDGRYNYLGLRLAL